jgi:hypothetical protein
MNSRLIGAISTIVAGLAGLAFMALEFVPQGLGFEDTDDPSVSLQFLLGHPEAYLQEGLTLLLFAITLLVATMAVSDVLVRRGDSLALRFTSTVGIFAAALLFMFGVLRSSVQPMLYIDSLSHDWGEAAYLVVQMAGVHGFAQGGLMALSIWAVGVSLIGRRTRSLPLALSLLALFPAFRLVALVLGPLGILPDGLWIVAMLAIPGTMVWCLLLGIVLLRKAMAGGPADESGPLAAVR